MHKNHNSIEDMINVLWDHFNKIVAMTDKDKNHQSSLTTQLGLNNRQWESARNELKAFEIDKDDVRHEITQKMIDVIMNNIDLRLEVNKLNSIVLQQTDLVMREQGTHENT